jgi:hypothetical protein
MILSRSSRLNRTFVTVATLALRCGIGAAHAAGCMPPPDFIDTSHPGVAPVEQLVSHTEQIEIGRPLRVVADVAQNMSLARTIHNPKGLPGIAGTYLLTKTSGKFGAPGSRQLDCLTDGSTLVEQVLDRTQTERVYHFRYVVWHYTTDAARAVDYGVGEFSFTATGPKSTHVLWIYSFQLNRHRFPGWLGPLGDVLFRWRFLDADYAALMRATLKGYKKAAEDSSG